MALNQNDYQASFAEQAAAAAAASAATGNTGGQKEQEAPAKRFSFASGTGFDDMSQIQSGSSIVHSVKKQFDEKYKDANVRTRVLPLLREAFGDKFRYSGLVVCASNVDRTSGNLSVAYHIMLIEATNPIRPDAYRAGNVNDPTKAVNLPRFAADGIDEDFIDAARTLVERSYSQQPEEGGRRLVTIYAYNETVPTSVKLDDPEVIGAHAVNALLATITCLKRTLDSAPFNLTETETTPFTLEHIFRDGSVADLNGHAVRSDVIVKMMARTHNKPTGFSVNGAYDGSPVALMSMYMDFLYIGKKNQNVNVFNKEVKAEPCFTQRAVITNTMCYKGHSLEMFLLSLYAAYSVYESGAARRSVINKQEHKGNLFDMTDLGATNVLANIQNEGTIFGPIYSVRGPEVSDSFKESLLDTVCVDVPLLALDCPVSGPTSWQTAVFQQAAEAGAVGKKAEAQLINAAMNLTGGAFAAFFPDSTPVIAYREIIPMGQWTDTEGTVRDIREYDTLAMLNRYGANNPEMVSRWVIAQTDVNRKEEVRLTETIEIMNDASGQRIEHTGRGVRVTLHPMFIAALREGIKLTDHTFTPNDTFASIGTSALRGAQFLNWSQIAANPLLNATSYKNAGLGSVIGNSLFSNLFRTN